MVTLPHSGASHFNDCWTTPRMPKCGSGRSSTRTRWPFPQLTQVGRFSWADSLAATARRSPKTLLGSIYQTKITGLPLASIHRVASGELEADIVPACWRDGGAAMPTEQYPTDRNLPQEPMAERGKEATTRTDSERAVAAVVRAIATEGHETRVEAARQDRGKALREWITVFLLGLAIVLLALLMVGLYWQVREMIAVYGPIRDQAEAAKKSAEAATRLSEAADQ